MRLRRDTDSGIFIARTSVGSDIGKEGERGEEQEEHVRRMRRYAAKKGLVAIVLCSKLCHKQCYSSEENGSKHIIPPSHLAVAQGYLS